MAIYSYVAFNKKGKEEKGIIDAASLQAARSKLKNKGLYVRSISEDSERKDRELFPFLAKYLYRIPRKEVGLFSRQLATLLGAGIPLDKSLSSIVEQTENQNFRKVITGMQANITEGSSLSEAMKKHPDVFPSQFPSLVAVGEKTGDYEATLTRLAELEEKSSELKAKVQVAMVYPFIMGSLSIFVTIFLLTVVIPQIQELFLQFDAKLPLITRIVIGVSDFLIGFWWLILTLGFGGIVGFIYYKNTPKGKRNWDEFVLKIPILGSLARKVLVSSFARNIGILLSNRVPLITTLVIVEKIVDHSIFGEEIKNAVEKIKEGEKLSSSFGGSVILPQMVLGMISAGEVSDRVPEMMNKLADIYDSEVDTAIKTMTQSMEPLMIVVMGLLIGTIMASIMVPMYNLTQQLQNI
ncbi:type II secretion system F family protein [Leptospira interrogans]|uniref:General secretion pathway protein F n=7 Tax=Leptospira interrogans TaxID=173 RepID=A0A7T6XE07_LEPIR|nr:MULTISPECIES: type II secretion system F family protein [Leptospira]ASV05695.1 type II secretion system protein F [Leptospira interrogans serovar Canicola]ASV09080.1 type II secretion system protein F [Leptospira interrogans serovar Canicola]EJO79683.1 type II secretion system protein F [Leptospira interrogans serovar Pomona str. Kennewicki LC82-25]EKN95542.1 type II secretion system protein F [Leptospira interrogans serovar Pomona str. Pomona]EKO23945.1 type II secretion system protein F [